MTHGMWKLLQGVKNPNQFPSSLWRLPALNKWDGKKIHRNCWLIGHGLIPKPSQAGCWVLFCWALMGCSEWKRGWIHVPGGTFPMERQKVWSTLRADAGTHRCAADLLHGTSGLQLYPNKERIGSFRVNQPFAPLFKELFLSSCTPRIICFPDDRLGLCCPRGCTCRKAPTLTLNILRNYILWIY